MKAPIIFIILLLFSINNSNAQHPDINHSKFDRLLKTFVDDNGMVNYDAFKNSNDFNEYLKALADANLYGLTSEEKLAFYINAYNAFVIKNVVNHLPINSPMDADGFFDKDKFTIAGKDLTLNEIEYNLIFKIEPVLCHFGLVCAGKSCPKLLRKAYSGSSVIEQLEENAKVFMNDLSKNKLDRDNKILYLSEIFKWFKDYFIEKYGSLKETAGNFMNESDSKFLRDNDITIKYLKYDWRLNKQ